MNKVSIVKIRKCESRGSHFFVFGGIETLSGRAFTVAVAAIRRHSSDGDGEKTPLDLQKLHSQRKLGVLATLPTGRQVSEKYDSAPFSESEKSTEKAEAQNWYICTMAYTLHIKNMVCNRCIKVVADELAKLDIAIDNIILGKVTLSDALTDEQLSEVNEVMTQNGFELLNDKKRQTIDKVKTFIIEKVHHQNEIVPETTRFSELIAQHLAYDYSYISHLFSTEEGITIEKYIISQKVERIKELLSYDELSIKEIAYQMNYSSAQHLSNQFKKLTGLTPTAYKQKANTQRRPLDKI